MKKQIFNVVAVMLLLTVNSCGEDFVENEPLGAINAESFFDEGDNADKAIIGIYDLMQFNYGRDWQSAFFVKMLPGDDLSAAGGNSGDQTPLQEIDDFTFSSSNGPIESVWNIFYQTISLSNLVVEKVGEGNLANKNALLAEAKFFRAWCHFELTTMFGAVPLRITVPTSPADFPIAKSSREELYAAIEADLADAIAGLPDKSGVAQPFRVSKGAAQALMGKVLVHQNKNSEAIPFLAAVISNPSHDLEPDINDVWSQNSDYGQESLLEIGYVSSEGYNWDGGSVEWGGRVESNLHVQLMGPRGDGIFGVDAVGLVNGWGFNLPTAKLAAAFNAAGDVDRKAATLLEEADLIAAGGSVDPTVAAGGVIWDYEGSIRTKYATRAGDSSADGVRELNYTVNWRIMRYAEVLLLAAEAYNQAGQDDNARTELNKVRSRAGLGDVTLSGDALFEAIKDEKFLELAHEGQRFWDLVRWGDAATELSDRGYAPKYDLFPIPASEINLNPSISETDQNPGY